jgi:hypothetical protein
MNQLRLLAVTMIVVLGAVVMPSFVGAAQETSIAIQADAELEFNAGYAVWVTVNVKCPSGVGTLHVHVTQEPPESPVASSGDGVGGVLCDGQTHEWAELAGNSQFDVGTAFATAELVTPSGTVQDERRIRIGF